MIEAGNCVLFQGDSITDAGRERGCEDSNVLQGLGRGYVNYVVSRMLKDRPGDDLRFFNRGISGNRVVDLYARWKIDAVNLEPDVISILVGVNDTWHEFMRSNGVGVERFETIYRMLLEYTRQRRPDVKLVLCEPFVTCNGIVTDEWVADVAARQEVVRRLCDRFGAVLVPFQSAYDAACETAGPEYWTCEGVHPTAAGHSLMAECWLKTVEGV